MEAYANKEDLKPLVALVRQLMDLQQRQAEKIAEYIRLVQERCAHRWKSVPSKATQIEHASLVCRCCGKEDKSEGAIDFYKRALKRSDVFFPHMKQDGLMIPTKYFGQPKEDNP